MVVIERVAETLGGTRALGRTVHGDVDLVDAVKRGFSSRVIHALKDATGLTDEEVCLALGLPARTFQRRKTQARIPLIESDRLYRLARVFSEAQEVLGDSDKARHWLRDPIRALGGRRPLDLLLTEAGTRQVEDVLGRIVYGVFS